MAYYTYHPSYGIMHTSPKHVNGPLILIMINPVLSGLKHNLILFILGYIPNIIIYHYVFFFFAFYVVVAGTITAAATMVESRLQPVSNKFSN